MFECKVCPDAITVCNQQERLQCVINKKSQKSLHSEYLTRVLFTPALGPLFGKGVGADSWNSEPRRASSAAYKPQSMHARTPPNNATKRDPRVGAKLNIKLVNQKVIYITGKVRVHAVDDPEENITYVA